MALEDETKDRLEQVVDTFLSFRAGHLGCGLKEALVGERLIEACVSFGC